VRHAGRVEGGPRFRHGDGAVTEHVASDDVVAILSGIAGIRSVERTDAGVRVHADAGDGLLARVVEAAAPAEVRDLSSHGATLESVFISRTGRELRD
jgi:hypothetical protein